jgi:hypothetical protein
MIITRKPQNAGKEVKIHFVNEEFDVIEKTITKSEDGFKAEYKNYCPYDREKRGYDGYVSWGYYNNNKKEASGGWKANIIKTASEKENGKEIKHYYVSSDTISVWNQYGNADRLYKTPNEVPVK